MPEIDPIEFGKLTNAVERLEKDMTKLTLIVEKMDNDMSRGKGIVFGMLMFAGGIGAGITKLLDTLSK